jgi:hypothetical protein
LGLHKSPLDSLLNLNTGTGRNQARYAIAAPHQILY